MQRLSPAQIKVLERLDKGDTLLFMEGPHSYYFWRGDMDHANGNTIYALSQKRFVQRVGAYAHATLVLTPAGRAALAQP